VGEESVQHPPVDVLLELGRLVWAGINLEDAAYAICRSIKPRHGAFDDIGIGKRINESIGDLGDRPADELRSAAEAWLLEAKASLAERNAVVHGIPGTFVLLSDEGPITSDPMLAHFPRGRKSPTAYTPVTVESLERIRQRLENARKGWAELATTLWTRRAGPA
jgi:hypothetical protein